MELKSSCVEGIYQAKDAWEEKDTPPQPPKCESKREPEEKMAEKKKEKHWSTTEKGAIVARATSFLHRRIIAPFEEGGLKEFFEKHCLQFEGEDFNMETWEIFGVYELKIETILNEFMRQEGIFDASQLMQMLREASSESKGIYHAHLNPRSTEPSKLLHLLLQVPKKVYSSSWPAQSSPNLRNLCD
jgi:hypothetical protein